MKNVIRYGLAAVLAAAALPGLHAAAAENPNLRLGLETYGPDRVAYSVESSTPRRDVNIISAAYDENGRMLELLTEPGVTVDGVHRGSQVFGQKADSFGVFVLDGNTDAPLTPAGRPHLCGIRDWNGVLLDSQTVLPGHAPVMPQPPQRPGYIFSGWGTEDLGIWDDAELQAQYLPENHKNVFQIDPVSGTPGQEVTVTLKLTGDVRLCGFDMRLKYDSSVLEFVSKNDRAGLFMVANHLPEKECVRFNYVLPSRPGYANLKKESTVMTVTFRIREGAEGSTLLKLTPEKVLWADDQTIEDVTPAEFAVTQGVISIK